MDCSVHETPLDHSFQKERRSLASKGSLGKRRRPSRYDIRNSESVSSSSFILSSEKESSEFLESCTKRNLENSIDHDESSSSGCQTTRDQVTRKREPSKSAVLIQTWERRSQFEKAQKLQFTLPCSKDVKHFHHVATAEEKESHLIHPLQEHKMLEPHIVSNYCAPRFHNGTGEEQNLGCRGYSSKEPRKWRTETDFKSRNRTTEVQGEISDEPEWISLSKKLCAKFIESHLESSNGDVSKDHQDVNHISHVKSNIEHKVSDAAKKTENSVSKEPQWVLLSKKLCTKFQEEHIENCEENPSPESVREVQRESVVTEKFPKASVNCRVQQREEPEWVSLSRKLRAKFIEGHLDDPDKVSFDSQLNASDLEENFSVPTLARKYLDYRNQTPASSESDSVKQGGGSNQHLLLEGSTVNTVSEESLTGKNKELSRSMPDMLIKGQMQTEEFRGTQREKMSENQNSDLECHRNAKNRDISSNAQTVRVNVDYEGFPEYQLSSSNAPTNKSIIVNVSRNNYNYTPFSESQPDGSVFFEDERCFAKPLYDSEDSVSANDIETKNSVHVFCLSPENESQNQLHQNGNISVHNPAHRRTSPTSDSERISIRGPLGDNGYFKHYSIEDDGTFHTVNLNSNSESIDSLEVKKTENNEHYLNYQSNDFDKANISSAVSHSPANNVSEYDYFAKNKLASSPAKNLINSQQRSEVQTFDCCDVRKHEHLAYTFTDPEDSKEEHVKNTDKLQHHQNEHGGHRLRHLKLYNDVEGSNSGPLLSGTPQLSHHEQEASGSDFERVEIGKSGAEARSSHDARDKNRFLLNGITLQEERRNQCVVYSSSGMKKTECRGNAKMLRNDCGDKGNELNGRTEQYRKLESNNCNIGSSPQQTSKRSLEFRTSDDGEKLKKPENCDHFLENPPQDANHQKLIVSFNVKPREAKGGALDVPCSHSLGSDTNQLPENVNKTCMDKNTDQFPDRNNLLGKAQKEINHSKIIMSKVFKCSNFEKPILKESAVFYRLCEDETLGKGQEIEHCDSFAKKNVSESPCTYENTRTINHIYEGNVNSGHLSHPSSQPVKLEDVSIEMVEEVKLKSSDKQRDVKIRLKPLGYLSKISNSNHSTNPSDRPVAKRTDSTKSHYVDYKDEHLYMNYNQEYGKIRSKSAYHNNKCHASAPDLSKDMKKEDEDQECPSISKAESQQEIKVDKLPLGVLSLDCILKMVRSPSLTELPDPSESCSVNRVVSSKESFSQTSPIISAKQHNGEGEYFTFDDQDYSKDSTSTSFCPSDSECSSWVMTRNNSYVINESSSMNESDISDCSLSVKCDYLSSCSNQNTIETRGRSSSESGSYMQMRNLRKEKTGVENAAEKSECATMSFEAGDGTKFQKPGCPATPESLRHLFQLPTKPLFPPTLHTSRVFISKDPPPIYASLSQSSTSSFKQNKTEERGRKTDRSSSLKIRDIAQGIILTFRRFQNISSTKQRHVSPSRYVDVSHLAECNRQVPKEWFSHGNNPSMNFLNGTAKRGGAGHSLFSASRPTRSQSESSGGAVNFRRQQNINTRAEKVSLSKKSCSRSSSDISSLHERTKSENTPETNGCPEKCKNSADRRTKKSNKNRSQQNGSKNRSTKRPESRNVTSISRKVQQMADGTLYLVTTVSGDSSVPGFYSDSVNTSERNSSSGRQTKAGGESNC